MKKLLAGVVPALAMAGLFTVAPAPAFAVPLLHANSQFCIPFTTICIDIPGGSGNPTGPAHGAPGPIAGAGLPFLALGFGAYWLIRRRKMAAN